MKESILDLYTSKGEPVKAVVLYTTSPRRIVAIYYFKSLEIFSPDLREIAQWAPDIFGAVHGEKAAA